MLVQFLCRRQCLILLLTVGLVLLLGMYALEKFAASPNETAIQRLIKLNQHAAAAKSDNEPDIIVDSDSPQESDRSDVGINVASVVVDGPKTLRREIGVLGGVGCKIASINPFSEEMTKLMYDFGKHNCSTDRGVRLDVSKNVVHVVGSDIDYIQTREINSDEKNGFDFGDFRYLQPPMNSLLVISKGKTGSIQNEASKSCIMPGAFDAEKPAEEISMIYSRRCKIPEANFIFTAGGLIIHKMTKKCIGPKGGMKDPPQNTQLVISSDCGAKFDVINGGVLQMKGAGSCVHPLWGGSVPVEGQLLCLYPECDPAKRLKYLWFHMEADTKKVETDKHYKLKAEMNHVKVLMSDEREVNTYVLTTLPKTAPQVESAAPNVIVISIEEASAPHFKRKLPLTYKVMEKNGFLEFGYHAAVSPVAKVNLMTMLNGHSSNDGDMEGSVYRLAKKHNYVTLFSADNPLSLHLGKGVNVDHSSIPYFRALKKQFNIGIQSYCVTGQPIYDISFNYLQSFLSSYPSHSKLAVILLSELIQVNYNFLGYMDKHFSSLIDQLCKLKNTIILIQTLKGGEKGKLGEIKQGIMEIKRPLLSTYVSEDIRSKYNFKKTRSETLSTPYDVHVTLRDVISSEKQKHNYGKTLLKNYKERNCLQAAIHPTMCPCV